MDLRSASKEVDIMPIRVDRSWKYLSPSRATRFTHWEDTAAIHPAIENTTSGIDIHTTSDGTVGNLHGVLTAHDGRYNHATSLSGRFVG